MISSRIPSASRVLIAPLNWGLGHATRCIPIIRELINNKCELTIASDGAPLELLKEEFPKLKFLTLPSYNVSYKYGSLATNVIVQSPKMAMVYRKENSLIKEWYKKEKWDVIISDCRYGVYHKEAKNILVTHQLNLQFDKSATSFMANTVNRQFFKSFQEIWVPDYEDHRLSGALSQLPKQENVHYLGGLSRMYPQRLPQKYDITVILSGPEPSRTTFENKLWNLLSETDYKIAWVRGIEEEWDKQHNNITMHNRVGTSILNQLLNSSNIVISRTGYTTVMDLDALNKRAILIPTPGQGEQEYLGKWLESHPLFTIEQEAELDNIILQLEKLIPS